MTGKMFLFLLISLAAILIVLVRNYNGILKRLNADSPADILEKNFTEGKISREEYLKLKKYFEDLQVPGKELE